MNLVLLFEEDFVAEGTVRLSDRRFEHIRDTIGAAPGKIIKAGLLNGNLGEGEILETGEEQLTMRVCLDQPPPEPLPLTLIFALPRPKTLKKVVHAAVSMGVKKIFIIECWKVDKSYWSSPLLEPGGLDEHIILGLEQGRDTVWPEIQLRRRFKPFVEDELENLTGDSLALAAHPGDSESCPALVDKAVTLCIGPEGGFTDYEVDMLQKHGCKTVSLGERIMRTEVAIPALIGRLF
jgi:RsmE family RNA methyltransferase